MRNTRDFRHLFLLRALWCWSSVPGGDAGDDAVLVATEMQAPGISVQRTSLFVVGGWSHRPTADRSDTCRDQALQFRAAELRLAFAMIGIAEQGIDRRAAGRVAVIWKVDPPDRGGFLDRNADLTVSGCVACGVMPDDFPEKPRRGDDCQDARGGGQGGLKRGRI